MKNHANAHRWVARATLVAVAALCACLAASASLALAATLPDNRSYELVTPLEKNGVEVGAGVPSTSGSAVNWEAPGGCCGASTAAQTLYQSARTSGGWQTKALTPTPNRPLVGLTEEQAPVFWTGDLSQTIFTTPASYATGDERPGGSGALDLYLQGPSGSLSWLSQGPFPGNGSAPDSATFDGAAPDAGHIVFSSAAQLTEDAKGQASLSIPPQFLYERDVAGQTTTLVNVFTTNLSADTGGRIASTLAANAVGTTTTGLGAGAGPAVATSLAANATGHLASTLTAAATAGESSIALASTEGFAAGQTITIDTGEGQESATIESVPDATHLTLSAGLALNHASGVAVAYGGDITIAVLNTEGLAAGEQIAIDPGGSEETATIAAVLDPTDLLLSADLTNSHASGAAVAHAGDSSIAVLNTEGFAAGQSIAIGAETATIAAVTDGTHLALSAPLASTHPEGAPVVHAGETSVTVASSEGLHAGEPITIDTGGSQETATIAAVPDGAHLTLGGPLANSHASGARVVYEGDTTIAVASTEHFGAGGQITIDTGAASETATIASVADATHLVLTAGLTDSHASGAQVAVLVDPNGAVLGDGASLGSSLAANTAGTTTNAVSSDGSKIFFESPEPSVNGQAGGFTHLYMRDLKTATTTVLDNPEWHVSVQTPAVQYEGAAEDGSLAFFTSHEGLAGEPSGEELPPSGHEHEADNELYEFNSTAEQIGSAPPMSVIPVSGGGLGSLSAALAAPARAPVATGQSRAPSTKPSRIRGRLPSQSSARRGSSPVRRLIWDGPGSSVPARGPI